MTRHVGRYELLRCLGRGGGGEVWEAMLRGPAGFRRRVAVKLLLSGAASSAAADLVQEARLGALVAHPNVVSTLELGTQDGQWYLVMDLVRGCSVRELRQQGPLPPAALLDIGIQVCEGLTHIHALRDHDDWPLGLVHRDIKLGNLMIDTSHRVQIVDLGIARLQGTSQVPCGTPGYVAPEQLDGQEGPLADVFSLGVTLTRLVTGVSPFGTGQGALRRVPNAQVDARATDPKLVRTLDDYLDGLGAVLSKAMRAEPSRRWSSARSLGDALERLYVACPDSPRLSTIAVPNLSSRDDAAGGVTTEQGAFVGRDAELDALQDLLEGPTRWVVAVGPGGVGKTRLLDEALRSRAHLRVDASRARTADGLCIAVAEALQCVVGDDPIDSLATPLQQVELLVLDEIEQGLVGAVQCVAAWLEAVPTLRVLCSSRVAPRHPDATLVRLGPLSMSDATNLFETRLGRSAPNDVVMPLVRLLDRLPLAVELAAARARRTTPERVLAQLQAHSSAQVPGLRDALEASWALLPPQDRDALVRLACWEGSFDAQDAVAVLGPAADPLHHLEQLVEHSMLHVRGNWFRLLTSVRAFARERAPEARRAGERRHGQWLARLGDDAMISRATADLDLTLLMARYLDDLVVASRRAMARGDADVAAGTAIAALQALTRAGSVGLALPLLDDVLPLGVRAYDLQRARGVALYRLGRGRDAEAAFEKAHRLAKGPKRLMVGLKLARLRFKGSAEDMAAVEEALDACHAAGLQRRTLVAREGLGQMYVSMGRLADAERVLVDVIPELQREGQDTTFAIAQLAAVHGRRGDLEAAVRGMRSALRILETRRSDLLQSVCRAQLAGMLRDAGEADEAASWARKAAESGRSLGYAPTVVSALATLQALAIDRADDARAAALTREIREALGDTDDAASIARAELASAWLAAARDATDHASTCLESAFARKHGQLEVVAEVVAMAAHVLPPERALGMVAEFERRLEPEETFLRLKMHVARLEAEHRAGRVSVARGTLLRATQALGTVVLSPQAPVARTLERLRASTVGHPAR